MFDIGTQELIIIFIVALLVIGPKKLPELARALGKGVRELKLAMQGLKDSINDAEEDITKDMNITKGINIKKDIKRELEEKVFPGDLFDLQGGSGEKKDKVSNTGHDKEGDAGGERKGKAETGHDG
jgi:Tat protein translocase TatB subunit